MIDRQHDQIVIECDACNNVFDPAAEGMKLGLDAWAVVWPAAKRDGWKARQIDDEWLHFCPGCKP
jgi:hypothetical protein